MITTIKIDQETKDRLLKLDLAEKGKSFNTMLIELIRFYEQNNEEYEKAMEKHKKQSEEYDKILKNHKKESKKWDKLLSWAKTQGFKE